MIIHINAHKVHIGPNLKLQKKFYDDLDIISTAKYQKKPFNMLCGGYSYHLVKYFFGICLCSMLIFFYQKSQILTIVLINQSKESGEENLLFFGLIWGPN